jgi:hypothetical protein
MAETISHGWWLDDEKLKAFEALVRADEREQALAAPVQPVAFEVGLVEWVGNKLMATPKVTTTPPASWVEMVTANLVREGVNKHKARELAEHFYGLAQPAPVPEGMKLVPVEPTQGMVKAFQDAMALEFGMRTTAGYHARVYSAMLAAAPAQQEPVQPVQEPVPDYAWPTVADYEKDVGFEVNDAFKMAWGMARTTNALFTQVEKNT